MPTGYTAAIAEGISFNEFVLQCARAFGALVTMRDDPSDAPIPDEFQPSDWNDKRLAEEEKNLEEFMALSPADHGEQAKAKYRADLADFNRRRKESDALKAKYIAMLEKVKEWTPPSPDHQGLKDFMVEQITQSISFDCRDPEPPKQLTGQQWADERMKSLGWSLRYHRDEAAKEKERVAGRNKWIKQLRESLK